MSAASQIRCQRCGAFIAVPPELHVLMMRCQYCGQEQPVPNAMERQRMLQQAQHQAQMQAQIMGSIQSAQNTGKGITRMVMIFVGLILLVTFASVGFSMARSMGLLDGD